MYPIFYVTKACFTLPRLFVALTSTVLAEFTDHVKESTTTTMASRNKQYQLSQFLPKAFSNMYTFLRSHQFETTGTTYFSPAKVVDHYFLNAFLNTFYMKCVHSVHKLGGQFHSQHFPASCFKDYIKLHASVILFSRQLLKFL